MSESSRHEVIDGERYLPWPDRAFLPKGRLVYRLLRDGRTGLEVEAETGTGRVVRILFQNVLAFRVSDEQYRPRTVSHLRDEGLEAFSLFRIEQSAFAEWFKWECDEVRGQYAQHYAVLTTESWVDVLADTAPLVQWCPEKGGPANAT